MNIEIRGNSDKVYDQVFDQVESLIAAEPAPGGAKEDAEEVTNWLWKHYASTSDAWKGTTDFEMPYDLWEEALDAYRQDKWESYEEGRIG